MCGRFDNLIARDAYRGLFKAQRLPKSNFPLRSIDDLKAMLKPFDPALMEAYAVNRAVNSVNNARKSALNP